MIYSNTLSDGINFSDFNVAGIENIRLIDSTFVKALTFSGDRVSNITIQGGASWNTFNEVENPSFSSVSEVRKSGTIYKNEIGFQFSQVSTTHNKVFDDLSNSTVTAIIGDNNGKYWLIGYQIGLRTTQYDKIIGETNEYTIKLSNVQKRPLYEVSPAYIQSLPIEDEMYYCEADYVESDYVE